mmetsp:Transcript_19568/g.3204  ORF Transcript_19568/g.3204 Transcript_19568/m.3204 type:complete len:83 (+) Transcript_19568:269-517(+)
MGLTNFGKGSKKIEMEGSSAFLTYFSLIKSMITGGILFMPKAFALGGWFFTIAIYCLLGLINTICMLWLSRASEAKKVGTYA